MNFFEAIILGLVQGLTEFLPVSSSGHLEIGKALFGISASENFYFTIAVHGATVLSTLVVFRNDILKLLQGILKFTLNEETIYILKLIVSMIPVGLAGIFLQAEVKDLFNGNMPFIGAMLLITAFLLSIAHFIRRKERKIGFTDALIIGVAQAIAVIPGISRSGATISTGMILGNRKDELAKFSFLMVLIPVIGANLLELQSPEEVIGKTNIAVIICGALAAFISGYLACKWMVNLVRRSKMIWFSLYCAIVGILCIILSL